MNNNPMWDEAERSLLGLFDFEKQRLARRQLKPFTLERVHLALLKLGHPSAHIPTIHIAGTKGKGSTALYLHYMLCKSGKKVGLFTSPHLVSLTERIRIGEHCISIDRMEALSKILHQLNQREFGGDLTFFEFLFLMAMMVFQEEKVDVIVLETGLGGRLDATNVVDPQMSIITRIDYDHCDILGYTLEAIALEKAGIIKPKKAVLALQQRPEVNSVFIDKAAQMDAPLHWMETSCGAREQNARLAIRALEILGWPTCNVQELLQLSLPGRWHEFERDRQRYIFDTAHNQVSLEYAASLLRQRSIKPQVLFAMGESRSPLELLPSFVGHIEQIYFCDLPGGRPQIEPEEMLRAWMELGGTKAKVLRGEGGIEAWLRTETDSVKLVTGSFYLVGEAYRCLGFHPDQLLLGKL